jgi:hypothetical protein
MCGYSVHMYIKEVSEAVPSCPESQPLVFRRWGVFSLLRAKRPSRNQTPEIQRLVK